MREKFKLYRKHILLVFLIIGGVLLAWFLFSMIFNPLRRPAPMIMNHILRHTPIGMEMEEVIRIIENNERLGSPIINRDGGFSHPNPRASPWDYSERVGALIIGSKSVQTRHAYDVSLLVFGFLTRNARVLWGFDENGKLIDVYVESFFSP